MVATASVEDDNIEALREATAANDHTVSAVVRRITELGAIPIVIGGGHNNAYGCLKGSSEAKERSINCLNIDAHTDLRDPLKADTAATVLPMQQRRATWPTTLCSGCKKTIRRIHLAND